MIVKEAEGGCLMLTEAQKRYRKEMKEVRRENPEYFINLDKYQRGASSVKRRTIYGVGLTGFIVIFIRLFLFIYSFVSPEQVINGYRFPIVSKFEAEHVIEEISSILDIYNDYAGNSSEHLPDDYYNALSEKKFIYATQLKDVVMLYFQLVIEYRMEGDPIKINNINSEIENCYLNIQNAIGDICNDHAIQVSFTREDSNQTININFWYKSL